MEKKTWDIARIGEDLGSIQRQFSEAKIDRYLLAIEARNPWYAGESPFGGAITPPLITSDDYALIYYDVGGYLREGFFHAKIDQENINPLCRGKRITTRGKIVDKYMRRGRKYLIIETLVTDEDGVEICRNKTTLASIRKFDES